MPVSVTKATRVPFLDRELITQVSGDKPVFVAPNTSLRLAMERLQQDSMAVLVARQGDLCPLGFLTRAQVWEFLLSAEANLDCSVASVMQTPCVTVPAETPVRQAALVMARLGVHELVLVGHDNSVQGIVTLEDLFGKVLGGAVKAVEPILAARSFTELAAAATDARGLVRDMVNAGLDAEQILRRATALNDLVVARVIDMMRPRFELPELDWCWMSFGSEARSEQTLVTDQDNGLIFSVSEDDSADRVRERFLPFAQAVNQALDDYGVPLCHGQIMAGNPAWCLSEAEWRARFRDWIVCGDAKALLNASIFFDFRGLYGEAAIVEKLRAWLLDAASESALFQRLMTQNALQCRPPIGVFRSFVLDRDKEHPDTIDLKMAATRPYVDAARLLALALRIPAIGTVDRLRGVARHVNFGKDDFEAMIDGFHFVQMLRLRNQAMNNEHGGSRGNRLNPYHLNSMERSILRLSMRQALRLQQRLKVDHRL